MKLPGHQFGDFDFLSIGALQVCSITTVEGLIRSEIYTAMESPKGRVYNCAEDIHIQCCHGDY